MPCAMPRTVLCARTVPCPSQWRTEQRARPVLGRAESRLGEEPGWGQGRAGQGGSKGLGVVEDQEYTASYFNIVLLNYLIQTKKVFT